MQLTGMISLFIVIMTKPMIVDSIIYTIDIPEMRLNQQTIAGPVIDYSIDDHIYILTARHLYKIDPDYLSIKDRIPLPQRFNYITTNAEHILLVSNNEIILLSKKDLAFKTGIGIEYGDYEPITTPNNTIAHDDNIIYLTSKSEGKSIVKIFDLDTGRLIKKKTISTLRAYEYSPQKDLITALNDKNQIIIYDSRLNEKDKLQLNFEGAAFASYKNGFLIYNQNGIFFITRTGAMIDFKPAPIIDQSIIEKFLFITNQGILYLDSLTLRPKKIFKGMSDFIKIFRVRSEGLDYALTLDEKGDFHLLDLERLTMLSMTRSARSMEERLTASTPAGNDSLWYFQIGAFSNRDNAQQMLVELKQQNIPAFIDSTDLYRVKLGGFDNKMLAIEIAETAGIDGWCVHQTKVEQLADIEFYIGTQKYILKNGIIIRSDI
jgi:hypothetical protein